MSKRIRVVVSIALVLALASILAGTALADSTGNTELS